MSAVPDRMTFAWGASFRRWASFRRRVVRAILGGAVLLAFSSVTLLSGCGQDTDKKGTTVKGTLLMDGKPLEVNDGTAEGSRAYVTVTINLVKSGDKPVDYPRQVKADGKFSIEGVEPGDYTLTVRQEDTSLAAAGGAKASGGERPKGQGGQAYGPESMGGGSGPPDLDRLEGAFGPTKSQIKVKVGTTSPQDLGTIDLKNTETWPK